MELTRDEITTALGFVLDWENWAVAFKTAEACDES